MDIFPECSGDEYLHILHYFCDRVKYGRENMSPVPVNSSPPLPPLKQPPPYTGTRSPVAGVLDETYSQLTQLSSAWPGGPAGMALR
jgi:hypothetical protein